MKRVIDFQRRWDAAKEQGELDFEIIKEFFQNYNQLDRQGINVRSEKWLSLTFSDSPGLLEKYKEDYLERNYHEEMLTEAASFPGADPPPAAPPRTLPRHIDSPTVGDEPEPIPTPTIPQTVEPRSFFKTFLPH